MKSQLETNKVWSFVEAKVVIEKPFVEYFSRNKINISTMDIILLKCDCIDRSNLKYFPEPKHYRFTSDKLPSFEFFLRQRQYFMKKKEVSIDYCGNFLRTWWHKCVCLQMWTFDLYFKVNKYKKDIQVIKNSKQRHTCWCSPSIC